MTDQRPSVGRMVHYCSYGTPGGEYKSVCRAAVIAEVGAWLPVPGDEPKTVGDDPRLRVVTERWESDACALEVHNPTGLFFNTCRHSEEMHSGGTWHWPEMVS